MKWTKYTLETTTEATDLISDMLLEIGIEGIEISDKIQITEEERKQLFIDFLPELGEDDGKAVITFYTDPAEESAFLLKQVEEGLAELSEFVNIGSGRLEISDTEDKDWINNWKQYFKPFRIDDTIVIKPTWEELHDRKETDLVLEIDPGTSFGTGAHETTKLCILSMKKYIKNADEVLDAGSGSGILSILARMLGAEKVLGIDIDPLATTAAIENSEVNGIKARELILGELEQEPIKDIKDEVGFITGNIIENKKLRDILGRESFDLIVANILADIIIPLSSVIGYNLKPGGYFISSGIINTKETAVEQALVNNGFHIAEVNRMGDWVSFVAMKE